MADTGPKGKRSAAALMVAAGILFSRIAGLARQRVFAHYLGNSDAAGAFTAALRIPNLLQNLFGEGVLSASFVPVYARLLAEGKEQEAGKVAGIIFSVLTLIVSGICVLGMIFARPMIDVLAPGFSGDVRELTIRMVTIMFPGTGILVISAWCLGVLNSHRRFFVSYVAPVVWNLAMIVALVVWGRDLMGSREGQMNLAIVVAWAMVAGSGLQLLLQLPWALKLNGGLKPSFDLSVGAVKTVIKNFVPAVFSRGVVQLSAYLDQILASFLGPQAVSAMGYAQMLYLLPVSLFAMSISSAELTEMSRTVGNDDEIAAAVKSRLISGSRRLSFLIVPSLMAFLWIGGVISAMLFQTGNFSRADSDFVYMILAGSTVGLFANTQSRLFVSAFWAMGDTKTPMNFAIIRVTLSAILGYVAIFPLRSAMHLSEAQAAALLTAFAGVAGWVEYLLVRRALSKRIGRVHVGFLALLPHWIAAIVAGALAARLGMLWELAYHPVVTGVLVISVYGALYLGMTRAMGVAEAKDLWSGMARRIGRGK